MRPFTRVLSTTLSIAVASTLTVGGSTSCKPNPEKAYSRLHQDSGLRASRPSYQALIDQLRKDLDPYGRVATIVPYGTSVEQRPLLAVRIRTTSVALPKVVVIEQAIHGNEYLALTDKVAVTILRSPATYPAIERFLANGGIIYLVPIVNPDGFERWTRANAHSVDLNRDFTVNRTRTIAFSEPESLALARATESWIAQDNGRFVLFFDTHCCQGVGERSLMHPWGNTSTLTDGSVPAIDVPLYRRAGEIFTTLYPGSFFGSTVEAIGYPTEGSVDEYVYERFPPRGATPGLISLTYEGPQGGDDLQKHMVLLDRLIGMF